MPSANRIDLVLSDRGGRVGQSVAASCVPFRAAVDVTSVPEKTGYEAAVSSLPLHR